MVGAANTLTHGRQTAVCVLLLTGGARVLTAGSYRGAGVETAIWIPAGAAGGTGTSGFVLRASVRLVMRTASSCIHADLGQLSQFNEGGTTHRVINTLLDAQLSCFLNKRHAARLSFQVLSLEVLENFFFWHKNVTSVSRCGPLMTKMDSVLSLVNHAFFVQLFLVLHIFLLFIRATFFSPSSFRTSGTARLMCQW